MFAYNKKGQGSDVHRNILRHLRRQVPVSRFRSTEKYEAKGGLIFNFEDGSFEHRMHQGGVPECLCVEAPDRLPLRRRVKANYAVMEAIIGHYENI
jgi:hypothetical protein